LTGDSIAQNTRKSKIIDARSYKMCGMIDIQRVLWTACLGFKNKESNKANLVDEKSRAAD